MLTLEEIKAALKENKELVTGLLPVFAESEAGKNLIENKAKVISEDIISTKISEVHKKYDDDMYEVLGIRPGTANDGTKEKTYAKIKSIYSEYKDMKSKGDFTKDDKVKELQEKLDNALKGGGVSEAVSKVQSMFDQAKQEWISKEEEYKSEIDDLSKSGLSFQKRTEINNAISNIKFNPDTPESVKKMIIDNVVRQIESSAKKEGDKFIYVDENGKTKLNEKYEPMTTLEVIKGMEAIKDISLKEGEKKGGGADPYIKGGVQEVKVEGKDETALKLNLVKGSFTTKVQFQEVANKLLLEKGITKGDPNFNKAKDAAYIEYGVKDLPTQ